MNYLLLFISVAADVAKNSCWNHFSKEQMNTVRDNCLFNAVVGIGAIVFFAVFGRQFAVSGYSMLLALIFALITAGAQYLTLLAMSCGPMSVTVLFTYLGGMLIPTVFGIIFRNQTVSALQIIGLVLMIVTIFIGTELKTEGKLTVKWLVYAVGSMILWGLVGVCQQIQQESGYAEEQNGFLFWAFVMMTVLFCILGLFGKKTDEDNYKVMSKSSIIIAVTGLFNGAVNLINLYLSGHMPSIIFFPIVNGGVIILAALAALVFFKEKPTKRQLAGIIIGLTSVVMLGLG